MCAPIVFDRCRGGRRGKGVDGLWSPVFARLAGLDFTELIECIESPRRPDDFVCTGLLDLGGIILAWRVSLVLDKASARSSCSRRLSMARSMITNMAIRSSSGNGICMRSSVSNSAPKRRPLIWAPLALMAAFETLMAPSAGELNGRGGGRHLGELRRPAIPSVSS